ncbi:uncharacterized protein [Procambarus clarkii]|uniref:uncharacterized protein n=1 Tax=Procambarus clarkii TaxID=6728 RepID=UPI0037420CEB
MVWAAVMVAWSAVGGVESSVGGYHLTQTGRGCGDVSVRELVTSLTMCATLCKTGRFTPLTHKRPASSLRDFIRYTRIIQLHVMERRSSTACMKCGVFYIPSPNQLCRLQCASCEKPPLGHYDIKCKRFQQIFCDNLYKTVKCPYCSPAPRGGHRRNETSHKRYNPYLNRRREQIDVIEPIPHSSHTELRRAHLTRQESQPLHQGQPRRQMGGYETVSPPVNTMLRIHTHSPAQPLHQDINDTPLCIDLASSDSCSSGSESDTAGRAVATSGSHREGRRTRSRPHSTPRSSPSPINQRQQQQQQQHQQQQQQHQQQQQQQQQQW